MATPREPRPPDAADGARAPPPPLPRRVFMNNFPYDTTSDQLRELLAPCGELLHVRMLCDADGRPRGIALIQFARAESADAAIVALDRTLFRGRRINVEYSRKQGDAAARAEDAGRARSPPRPPPPPYPPYPYRYPEPYAYPDPYGYYDRYRAAPPPPYPYAYAPPARPRGFEYPELRR
jgi:RNA recognition motif-containing protein